MKPYSKDLRLKVLAAVDRGMPRKEVVRVFGVSEPTIRRYLRLRRQTGDVEPRPLPGPPARKREALEQSLPAQVRLNPDLTLEEHCELFEETSDMEVHGRWCPPRRVGGRETYTGTGRARGSSPGYRLEWNWVQEGAGCRCRDRQVGN